LNDFIKNTQNYVAIRDVAGDGNCFYRAVMYAYIEYLIVKKNQYLNAFIKFIGSGEGFNKYNDIDDDIIPYCIKKLSIIEKMPEEYSDEMQKKLRKFYDLFRDDMKFDQCIQQVARVYIASYIDKNKKSNLNGMTIEAAARQKEPNLAQYIQKHVLDNRSYAGDLVLPIAPIAFRININIITPDYDLGVFFFNMI